MIVDADSGACSQDARARECIALEELRVSIPFKTPRVALTFKPDGKHVVIRVDRLNEAATFPTQARHRLRFHR